MSGLLSKLTYYLGYPFVRYALIVGILISLCSSLLGVTLVLKRYSYIGDGLSHVAFGAMAIAAVMRLTNNMPLVLAVTIICAVLLLRTGQNARITGDAAIGMISVASLALGYLLMNLFQPPQPQISQQMFALPFLAPLRYLPYLKDKYYYASFCL